MAFRSCQGMVLKCGYNPWFSLIFADTNLLFALSVLVSDPGSSAKRPKMEMLNFFKEKEEKQTTFRNEQMSLMKDDFTLRLQKEEARTKKTEEVRVIWKFLK